MKKSLILFLVVLFIYPISAANMYNHVYNGSSWVPALSTADGQQKYWIEMTNATYGNVVANLTIGEKIIFNLGETIDNLVDGWVRMIGNLNVTGNLIVKEDVNISGDLKVFGNISGGSPVKIIGGLKVMNNSGSEIFFVNTTNGEMKVTGPITTAFTTKTSNYTITSSDSIIAVNVSTGGVNITLPTAVGIKGRTYTIKKIDSSNNAVIILGDGSESIEGESVGKMLDNENEFLVVTSDNVNWIVTGGNADPALISGCGGTNSVVYNGTTYNTVAIGDQCWLNKNMNVGVMIASPGTMPNDNGIIEKWCNGADGNAHSTSGDCETYGGLYAWNESMGYSDAAGAQGICPNGWHIPTDNEWKTMEMALGMSQAQADATGWRGTDEGTKLKVGGTSDFEGLLTGYRNTNGLFYGRGVYTNYWSSSESGGNAWGRHLNSGYATVNRNPHYKGNGFSVRCLKD